MVPWWVCFGSVLSFQDAGSRSSPLWQISTKDRSPHPTSTPSHTALGLSSPCPTTSPCRLPRAHSATCSPSQTLHQPGQPPSFRLDPPCEVPWASPDSSWEGHLQAAGSVCGPALRLPRCLSSPGWAEGGAKNLSDTGMGPPSFPPGTA